MIENSITRPTRPTGTNSISGSILFNREQIAATVSRLASEITLDYHDKNPILIGILKGSFIFLADLVRLLDFPLEVDFVKLSSYGKGQQSSGKVEVVQGLDSSINGRDVLIVEDIIDTGTTIAFFLDYLKKKKPASLKLCSLVNKPFQRRASITINYLGFSAPNRFLVGYGLDYAEQFRNLPNICLLER